MSGDVKRFSSQEVFTMTWAVVEAINQVQRDYPRDAALMTPNIIADAVRSNLESGADPIGLRVVYVPKAGGGGDLCWHARSRKQ